MRTHFALALMVALACGHGPTPALSQTPSASSSSASLDTPVAPIALYPDPLVAQSLPA